MTERPPGSSTAAGLKDLADTIDSHLLAASVLAIVMETQVVSPSERLSAPHQIFNVIKPK